MFLTCFQAVPVFDSKRARVYPFLANAFLRCGSINNRHRTAPHRKKNRTVKSLGKTALDWAIHPTGSWEPDYSSQQYQCTIAGRTQLLYSTPCQYSNTPYSAKATMLRTAAGIVLAVSSAAGQSVFFSEIRFDDVGADEGTIQRMQSAIYEHDCFSYFIALVRREKKYNSLRILRLYTRCRSSAPCLKGWVE